MDAKATATLSVMMSSGLVGQKPRTLFVAASNGLFKPGTLIVDHSLTQKSLAAENLAAPATTHSGTAVMKFWPARARADLRRQHATERVCTERCRRIERLEHISHCGP